ncbi:hypothetical protein HCA89_08690 [Listeria innocua]|uniref:Uncharacterized protein n=1 Tax=Listeria innocua TaxID=1642 RepID=A0AB73H9E6_LISIO|nr:hypothetical protein [Listeria innocua]MBC2142390.1 hypothetical protein [Listeria innocua]
MDQNLIRWLSLIGVIIFVGSVVLFSAKVSGQRKKKLQEEFERNFSMYKVFFNRSNEIIEELNYPILTLKRSNSGRFILPVFICFITFIIGFFYRGGSFNIKLIILAILGLWFVWSVLNATNYVKIYENALVHGNLLKKKIIWYHAIDSIEARLYDYNGVMDARQAGVYRVYEVMRNGKVICGIWETEFSGSRKIENCFNLSNPLVTEIRHSFDSASFVSKEEEQ